MASLQLRREVYSCIFCWQGKRHWFKIGAVSEKEAEAKAAQVEYLLMRLKQRLVELTPGVNVVDFVQHDGKPPAPSDEVRHAAARRPFNLADLRDRFLDTHAGAHENSSLKTSRIHFKHLVRVLGEAFPLSELKHADLQRYVEARAEAVTPATIRKEVQTLGTAWNWGRRMGFVGKDCPNRGLVYQKTDEKPPFQTVEEIERRLAGGGLTPKQVSELWNSLYLRPAEVASLLEHVKASAAHPWVYPLVCTAAYTGMRRSELMRARIVDVDFQADTVTIREKKRVKGQRSTRRAPLTPMLAQVLKEWLAVHPGGQHLFCHAEVVERSKKRSRTTGHQDEKVRPSSLKGRRATVRIRTQRLEVGNALSEKETHDHLKRTIRGSKWSVVRGYHVLRHSFVSALAAAGVDQRIIDDIIGHSTEEQRRRYRHLLPDVKHKAVAAVFEQGGAPPAGNVAAPRGR